MVKSRPIIDEIIGAHERASKVHVYADIIILDACFVLVMRIHCILRLQGQRSKVKVKVITTSSALFRLEDNHQTCRRQSVNSLYFFTYWRDFISDIWSQIVIT